MIPANASRRTIVDQEDSQIQSAAMMGVINTQERIFNTEGNVRTQFQSKSSHSGFTISAIKNPTHSITKVKTAYELSTRGTVMLQNDESSIVTLPDTQDEFGATFILFLIMDLSLPKKSRTFSLDAFFIH